MYMYKLSYSWMGRCSAMLLSPTWRALPRDSRNTWLKYEKDPLEFSGRSCIDSQVMYWQAGHALTTLYLQYHYYTSTYSGQAKILPTLHPVTCMLPVTQSKQVLPTSSFWCCKFFWKKFFVQNNTQQIDLPTTVFVIDYSHTPYFMILIFVVLHNCKNISRTKNSHFMIFCNLFNNFMLDRTALSSAMYFSVPFDGYIATISMDRRAHTNTLILKKAWTGRNV